MDVNQELADYEMRRAARHRADKIAGMLPLRSETSTHGLWSMTMIYGPEKQGVISNAPLCEARDREFGEFVVCACNSHHDLVNALRQTHALLCLARVGIVGEAKEIIDAQIEKSAALLEKAGAP